MSEEKKIYSAIFNLIERVKNNRKTIYDLLIYIVFSILMVFAIGNKENLYVDEVYSYGLANHTEGSMMCVEEGYTYYPSNTPWMNYMAVNPENRFDYRTVWANQKEDVHPPLYYVILHTICTFFPESFSIWFAGMINIFSALGTLFFLRKTVLILTGDVRLQRLISIAFASSAGILSAATFLRMYMLAMFWVTALTCLMIGQIGIYNKNRFYLLLFLYTTAGALTHYYCIVFAVFISIVYGCILLQRKYWKKAGFFCLVQGIAAVVSIAIFPAMIGHMFSSGRGQESADNLIGSSLSAGLSRIKWFFEIVDEELFGGIFIYLFFAALAILFVGGCCHKRSDLTEEKKVILERYLIISIPVILYFLLVSKIAVFITDRYMYPVYAVLFLGISCALGGWMKGRSEQYYIYILTTVLTVMTVNGWKNMEWEYLYKSSAAFLDTATSYADVDCIYVYDKPWKTNPAYYEISKYHSVTFFTMEHLDMLGDSEISSRYRLLVAVTGNDEAILNQIMDLCPELNVYEYLGGYGYSNTYYLYGM